MLELKNKKTNGVIRPASARAVGVRGVVALTDYELETFFPGSLRSRLEEILPEATRLPDSVDSAEAWASFLEEVDPEVLVTGWQTRPLPAGLDALRYVCHVTGSVRFIVPREMIVRGVSVTNWGNLVGSVVAEHALVLLLGLLRSAPHWAGAVAGEWSQENRDRLDAKSLFGRRVSIHGFGEVGRALLKLLAPFGVDVMAYSHGVPSEVYGAHGVRAARDLVELAAWGDVFVTCEALTERSAKSIDADVLSALPRGSVFVNVGRGAIVDEEALGRVALERELRVGCDVFEVEPLPRTATLLKVPTSLYTPHLAGPTPDVYPKCGALALANLERFLSGLPLEHAVTAEQYDRST